MKKTENLTGKEFNHWVVLEKGASDKTHNSRWLCRCVCGKEKLVVTSYLKNGRSKSCGCVRKPKKQHNITGKVFNRWTVIKRGKVDSNGNAHWMCRCECGTEKEVLGRCLKKGESKSCGCLRRDKKHDLTGEVYGKLKVLKQGGYTPDNRIMWTCLCECGKTKDIRAKDLKNGKSQSCGCERDKSASVRFTKDYTGKKFGRLMVQNKLETDDINIYKCLCSCGNTKTTSAHGLISGNTKSCGCLYEERTGEDNPNYNSNLTEQDRQDRRLIPGYSEFVKEAMERDDYTCQSCLTRGGDLAVHHKHSYAEHEDLRTTVSNGITLCSTCHTEFHDIFGYGDNTKFEFDCWVATKRV